MMTPFAPSDAEAFRALSRTWAASVTVVTAQRDQGPFTRERPRLDGFTATHFLTVSIDPPIVLVSAARDSGAYALLADVERFAVNLLSGGQTELALAFARTQSERGDLFEELPWKPNAEGVPLLAGTLGAFSARVRTRLEAGDHTLVLGDVTAIHQGPPGDALVYQNRVFRRLR